MKKNIILPLVAATLACSATAMAAPPLKRNVSQPRNSHSAVQSSGQSPIQHSAGKQLHEDLSRPAAKVRANAPAAGVPQIFGAVISSATLSPGMYEIPSNAQSEFVKIKMENANNYVNAADGGVRVGNRYYSSYSEELVPGWSFVYTDAWDINDSGWVKRWNKDSDADIVATDFAVDPTTNTTYGSLSNADDGYELCKVTFPNYKSGSISRTAIGILSTPLYAMAVSSDGVLYALQSDGQVVIIDKSTAAVTPIAASGLSLTGKGSGVIDPTTGKFYCTAALTDGTSGLYEISLTSGTSTLVYSFPGNEQVTGLYCNPSEAVAAAPGKATLLSADFPGGGLSGTVSFTAPTTDANGNAAQGTLSYNISLDGNTLATGETEYGAPVSAAVTLPDEGDYELTVVLSNAGGAGAAATLKVRVGKGLPATPIPSASWLDGKMTVSWPAVKESADGRYIDPQEITYTVTRFPGAVVVATDTKLTSVEDSFELPGKFTVYHYEVVATYADKSSAAGRTDNVGVGAYTVPFNEDFGTPFYRGDLIDTYTIIDANDDGQGWQYNSYTEVMRCRTMANSGAADDWLILPAITMEKGMAYELTAQLKDGGDSLKEQFEVRIGKQNKPEALTTVLIPEQEVESAELKDFKSYIAPSEDGDYYIGFHCTTPTAGYYLYLDNISVVAKADAGLAQAPTDLVVTPDENGLHTAHISFTAPTLNVSGGKLSGIDKIVLSRDGTAIHEFIAPTPGSSCTYDDTTPEAGSHDYSVAAFNKCGEGDHATASAFVGIHKPAHPEQVTARETDTYGRVTVSWSSVTTDENGKALSPDKITYSVVRLSQNGDISEIIAEELTANEHTFTAIAEGEQAFINFAVFAKTEGGYSKGAIAPQIITGTPYSLPYRESFEGNGLAATTFSMATLNGSGYWMSMSDDTFADMESHDHDTGYIAMAASAEGDKAALTTARISLKDVVNPVLSFYIFNMAGDWGRDDNEVEVQVGVNGKFTTLYNQPNYETGNADQWNLVAIPLTDYEGKDIQVRFIGTCHHASYTILDEIEIKPYALLDIRAVDFTAPERLVANKPVTIVAEVENNGMHTASGGAVILYANDYAYMRQELPTLDFGKSTRVAFDCSINPSFGKNVTLRVKVDLNGDVNPGNDRTPSKVIDLEQTLLPTPTNLCATQAEGGKLAMSWDEPDLSLAVAERVTEDFESAKAWTNDVTDWSFADLDKGGINGFDGVTFPGIPDGSQQSFWVMDDRLEDLNNTFAAASGHQYLANMNVVEGATDDWAISPRLCGRQQTLSFYARSYNWMFPETFYLMYSTTGADTDDFKVLKQFYEIPWDWKEYSATLPEGTTYFAIRSNTTSGVMLFIDDVSYVPEATAQSLNLLGYQFYCDGIPVNDTPIKDCNYLAGGYNPVGHTYTVTALYDKGESAPANPLYPTGMEAVADSSVNISSRDGNILITGAEGLHVRICNAAGVSICDTRATDNHLSLSVAPGLYIVTAGTKSAKIIVR